MAAGRAVALTGLLLALSGCAGSPPRVAVAPSRAPTVSPTPEPVPTVVASSPAVVATSPAPAAPTQDFGFFVAVLSERPLTLSLDRAVFYSGAEAQRVAASRGDTAFNDYYIVNDSKALRTVTVADNAQVFGSFTADGSGGDGGAHPRTLADLIRHLRSSAGPLTAWHLVSVGGRVVRIQEQFRP